MKKIYFVFMALSISLSCAVDIYADWEWWNETETVCKINEDVELGFTAEQKFKNDMEDLYCYNFQGGINFKLSNFSKLGFSYKYEKEREITNNKREPWLDEHRIQIDPVLKWQWFGFNFKDRNRLEYRILEDRKDRWRYRNRIKVEKPLNKFTPLESQPFLTGFTPYFANEMFYDFYKNSFNKDRLEVGIARDLTSNLEVEIYYMLESSKNKGSWAHSTNVLGTVLKINF